MSGDDVEKTGPHPAVAATRNEGTIVVNTKVVIGLLVLLLGGTVGGGGISLANANKEPSAEVVEKVNDKLGAIVVTLTEMKSELKASADDNKRRDKVDADHEERLRKIEEKIRIAR